MTLTGGVRLKRRKRVACPGKNSAQFGLRALSEAIVEVLLVSDDERLFKLCSDILSEWKRDKWSLSAANSFPVDADYDLYLWDCRPQKGIPARSDLRGGGKHLFLVHRMDLGWFRTVCRSGEEAILLKPVTRATLSAFLQQSVGFSAEDDCASRKATCADRDDLFQSLIEANLRLQEYDQDRTNFLARAVHDFRAPLTAISGYCGLFLAGALGPLADEQREVLQRMEHSAKRLFRLSSAMFELSVSPHRERHKHLDQGDVRACVANGVHMLQPVFNDKHISVAVDLQQPQSTLYFDAGQIEQVLANLLDNAGKFTPRHGSIEIRGYDSFWERRSPGRHARGLSERRSGRPPERNCYRVDVIDNGPGIHFDHLNRIFEEYAQVEGGEDRSGAGLGLAICRMILSQHNGRIWAESTGSGAVFSFVLPYRAVELSLPPVARAEALEVAACSR